MNAKTSAPFEPPGTLRPAKTLRPLAGVLGLPLPPWVLRADRAIERLVTEGANRRTRLLIVLALVALMGLSVWLQLHSPGFYATDLYLLCVMAACFAFRESGLWTVLICLGVHDLTELARGPLPPGGLQQILARNAFSAVVWTSVGFFTTTTLARYVEIRRYQKVKQQDAALARTLQRALMPGVFESERVRVYALIEQTMEIGGDFCYFRPFKEKYVMVSLGDIMGKGTPASMVMAIVMGFFYEWGKQSLSPADILGRLNERLASLWQGADSWFVTMFYAIYDEETRELVYSSGGHQAALVVHADASRPIEELHVEGLPIGIFGGMEWEEKRVTLEPGDRLVVFTDGVNEARNATTGEQFTLERLLALLSEHRSAPPAALAALVSQQVRAFSESDQLSDDLAIMVMQVKS
jgi:Stage II sporulation protein E (SpoIIE)